MRDIYIYLSSAKYNYVLDVVNKPRYADDTVIIVESEQQRQQLINTLVTESELKGLYLNSTKSLLWYFRYRLLRMIEDGCLI